MFRDKIADTFLALVSRGGAVNRAVLTAPLENPNAVRFLVGIVSDDIRAITAGKHIPHGFLVQDNRIAV